MKKKRIMSDEPTEREAIGLGLLLLAQDYEGNDDFSKGMRLLQRIMGRNWKNGREEKE